MLLRLFMPTRQQLEERPDRGVSEMFRALRHQNFRLFWSGAFLSNTGTWMQAVAQGWLVLSLSNSPFWLGVDGFMATAPGLFLTLAGGVFAPWLFGWIIGTGSANGLVVGYMVAAILMVGGAMVELWIGVAAERRPLEDIAAPLSSRMATP